MTPEGDVMLKSGLYEQIINQGITEELKSTDKIIRLKNIDEGESSKVLAQYASEIIEKGLNQLGDDKLPEKIELINKMIEVIRAKTGDEDFTSMSVDERAEQLLALLDKENSKYAIDQNSTVIRPETSIAQSSLFTSAVNEPQLLGELKKEIVSADRIDMIVSFIKWSGVRRIINELKDFTDKGGELRIITTSYMGATDVKAIEELRKLSNTMIKVSYDTKVTRLHVKSYVFYRDTGFTTAYVGSSNLSGAAISTGREWNVKVTNKDLPDTIKKISATFESYWNSNDFEYYSETQKERLARALKAEKYHDSNDVSRYTVDVKPYAYQQEILDKLEAQREVRGNYRNLIVAATGTGKTVISALDYKRFVKKNSDKKCRLLFVAHRKEILEQSIFTFRAVLKDANFGELFVGQYKAEDIDNLFISIQTFNSQDLTSKTSKDFYDFIIVDEFHHAAAPIYQKLLEYYEPKILLGLTATPERMDGKSILTYFNDCISAEIRLPEAIDRMLLCPFQYFGVTDNVDLSELKWSAGGYDKTELSNIYTINEAYAQQRADLVVNSLLKYVTDIDEVKGLGFCVTVAHSEFMAAYFNAHGIPSISLSGQSSDEDRDKAQSRLVKGEIRFIFVVDIYNEGVDIPEVNTVLFLRPTESLTIFLQQLGRGLRLADNKECLTVLDFIGQANKKYNFEDKFAALLSNTNRSVTKEIKNGFVSVPKGCYIQLEKMAERYILSNIRASYGNTAGLISKIESFEEDSGLPLSLANFLEYHHLDVRTVYKFNSFSRLCARADVIDDFESPVEETITKALSRLSYVDSRRFIKFIIKLLSEDVSEFTESENRMLQMFHFTIWQKEYQKCGFSKITDGVQKIRECPVLCNEIIELLEYNYNQIDFIDKPVDVGFDCPLDLYCTYTRDQILSALDYLSPSSVQAGTFFLADKKIDIHFITLNKSEKDYSPTTMYNDYSINSELFHWQSQGATSDTSNTGTRYINHQSMGVKELLFVRERKNDNITGKAAPYSFIGLADYVSHTDSKPMNIIWKMKDPIPAKYLRKTNKMIVG